MRSDYTCWHMQTQHTEEGVVRRRTCEGHTHMLIEGANLPNCSLLLQLGYRFLFHTQNHDVFAPDSNL